MNPNGLLALRFFVKTYVITFRFTSSATLMRHLAPYLHLHYTTFDIECQEVFQIFSFFISTFSCEKSRGQRGHAPFFRFITYLKSLDAIAVTIGQVAFAFLYLTFTLYHISVGLSRGFGLSPKIFFEGVPDFITRHGAFQGLLSCLRSLPLTLIIIADFRQKSIPF